MNAPQTVMQIFDRKHVKVASFLPLQTVIFLEKKSVERSVCYCTVNCFTAQELHYCQEHRWSLWNSGIVATYTQIGMNRATALEVGLIQDNTHIFDPTSLLAKRQHMRRPGRKYAYGAPRRLKITSKPASGKMAVEASLHNC